MNEGAKRPIIYAHSCRKDLSDISYSYSEGWYNTGDGVPHREDGPAFIMKDGNVKWYCNGFQQSFEDWCVITKQTDEEIVRLKLKYG